MHAVGDAAVGKTSLMVRYVERRFDSDYIETLGVNFMEKVVQTDSADVTLSLWCVPSAAGAACHHGFVATVTVAALSGASISLHWQPAGRASTTTAGR